MPTPVKSTAVAALSPSDAVEPSRDVPDPSMMETAATEPASLTDRLFQYPHGRAVIGATDEARKANMNSAKLSWLAAHNVHTEFVDAGVGCCWLAGQGEDESIPGATEDEALAELARAHGWELWTAS